MEIIICMCLDVAKKPQDFTRLTQEYGIRHVALLTSVYFLVKICVILWLAKRTERDDQGVSKWIIT